MYTREETIILPILMRRVLTMGYYDYFQETIKPEYVSVQLVHGTLMLTASYDYEITTTSFYYRTIIALIARTYGINRAMCVCVLNSGYAFAEDNDFTIYQNLKTYGQLKLID